MSSEMEIKADQASEEKAMARRQGRNRIILAALLSFVGLVYLVSVVRMAS